MTAVDYWSQKGRFLKLTIFCPLVFLGNLPQARREDAHQKFLTKLTSQPHTLFDRLGSHCCINFSGGIKRPLPRSC